MFAQNETKLISELATRLNINLDETFALKAVDAFTKKRQPFPCPCTYRTALTHYVELTQQPGFNVLGELVQYANDEKEAARLKFLVSKEGRHEFNEYINANVRTIFDVRIALSFFPSMPLGAYRLSVRANSY